MLVFALMACTPEPTVAATDSAEDARLSWMARLPRKSAEASLDFVSVNDFLRAGVHRTGEAERPSHSEDRRRYSAASNSTRASL